MTTEPGFFMERLFPPEAHKEHAEMYLKAISLLREAGEAPARVNSIARVLGVKPPSVVGMLTKLKAEGLVRRFDEKGVGLTSRGARQARRLLRNCRLVEVFMHDALGIKVDDRVACNLEHRLTETFTDGLCGLLHHPRTCPHGKPIPKGKCCKATPASLEESPA